MEGGAALPQLSDPRHEAFAQARARGANRSAAYAQAGYAPNRTNGSKLAAKPAVAARIAELERRRDQASEACLRDTIIGLMAEAHTGEALKSAAGLREARLARLDANRLWGLLQREEAQSRRPPDRELTLAEWTAKYGRPAPG
jgi:hypothetical protein